MENIIYWIMVGFMLIFAGLLALSLILETPQQREARIGCNRRRMAAKIEAKEIKKLERRRAQRQEYFDVMRDIYGVDD